MAGMARFGDLKRYLERNGWENYKTTDHWFYQKVLPDKTVLMTKVSFSVGKEIPAHLWHRILKKQLKITQEEFNRGQ